MEESISSEDPYSALGFVTAQSLFTCVCVCYLLSVSDFKSSLHVRPVPCELTVKVLTVQKVAAMAIAYESGFV